MDDQKGAGRAGCQLFWNALNCYSRWIGRVIIEVIFDYFLIHDLSFLADKFTIGQALLHWV
jgi:hypothetical protein